MCRNVTDGLQQESQLLYIVRDLCSLFLKLFVSIRGYFVDETKQRGVVKMQEGKAAIQRDLARLEKWADRNLKILNKSEFQAFHLGGNNPYSSTGWGPVV